MSSVALAKEGQSHRLKSFESTFARLELRPSPFRLWRAGRLALGPQSRVIERDLVLDAREASEIKKWPADGLRHSWGTYRFALICRARSFIRRLSGNSWRRTNGNKILPLVDEVKLLAIFYLYHAGRASCDGCSRLAAEEASQTRWTDSRQHWNQTG